METPETVSREYTIFLKIIIYNFSEILADIRAVHNGFHAPRGSGFGKKVILHDEVGNSNSTAQQRLNSSPR